MDHTWGFGESQYYINPPQYNMYPEQHQDEMVEEQEDDGENDNFYGYDDIDYPLPSNATAFAQAIPAVGIAMNPTSTVDSQEISNTTAPTTIKQQAEVTKQINEQKLAELRAKLMATRTATPGKDRAAMVSTPKPAQAGAPNKSETPSRSDTPSKALNKTKNKNNTATPIKSIFTSAKRDIAQVNPGAAQSNPTPTPTPSVKDTSMAIDELLADGLAAADRAQQEKDMQQPTPQRTVKASFSSTNMPSTNDKNIRSSSSGNSSSREISAPTNDSQIKQDPATMNKQDTVNKQKKPANQSAPTKNTDTAKGSSTMNTNRNDDRNRPSQNIHQDRLARLAEAVDSETSATVTNSKQSDQIGTAKKLPSNQQQRKHDGGTLAIRPGDMGPPPKARLETSNITNHDEYERDVETWLEITGFHDKAYREERLGAHRRRARLEERRRALEEEFAELERQESAAAQDPTNVKYLRPQSVMPPSSQGAIATTENSTQQAIMPNPASVAGTKRPLSPSNNSTSNQSGGKLSRLDTTGRSARTDIRPQDNGNGYRIRGAVDDSPVDVSMDARNRMRSPSPAAGSLARRISYPDRRSSFDDGPPFDRYNRVIRGRDPSPRGYQPRHGRNFSPGRGPFSNSKGNGFAPRQGDRYFIIKSWTEENVFEAQERGYWSTQDKHTQLFEEAFHESRNVILFFSVNKSMAFQGVNQAIMTSPPDLRNPQPDFARRLNWKTSPSFSIRWIVTTPVHFRYVGHLKNTLNRDEVTGEPRAVLVGRDAQEISEDAGRGVVKIMQDAEAEAAAANGPGGPGGPGDV